jgi:hypothetical protein
MVLSHLRGALRSLEMAVAKDVLAAHLTALAAWVFSIALISIATLERFALTTFALFARKYISYER